MSTITRFHLNINAEEKDIISRAAALADTTMADFVLTAAKEKAFELLGNTSRITLSDRDFQAFKLAINEKFTPNDALQKAMSAALNVRHI